MAARCELTELTADWARPQRIAVAARGGPAWPTKTAREQCGGGLAAVGAQYRGRDPNAASFPAAIRTVARGGVPVDGGRTTG